MESKHEYQVFDPERKRKFQSIADGVYQLMAAMVEKAQYDLDSIRVDQEIEALKKKYPRAAAYLKAQQWSWSAEQKQADLGKKAMDRILDGDDPAVVLEEMESSWAAFNVAQEG